MVRRGFVSEALLRAAFAPKPNWIGSGCFRNARLSPAKRSGFGITAVLDITATAVKERFVTKTFTVR